MTLKPPFPTQAYTPKFVFAAMLFAQGCGLLFDWLVAPRERLETPEWSIVVVIAIHDRPQREGERRCAPGVTSEAADRQRGRSAAR